MASHWTFIIVMLLVAGCAGKGPSSHSTTESATPSHIASPGTTSPSPSPPAPFNRTFLASDCHGAGAGITMHESTAPPAPNDDWTATGLGDNRGELRFLRCERVAIFDFERGPVTFAYEVHTNATPPSDDCFGGRASSILVLYNLYVDDHAIVANISARYGAPVKFASFDVVDEPLPTGRQQTWTMDVEGGGSTRVTFTEQPGDPTGGETTTRYVYPYGSGVAFLEEVLHEYDYLTNPPASYGEMGAPTMWHDYGPGTSFAGTGSIFYKDEWSGEFFLYEDSFCKVAA